MISSPLSLGSSTPLPFSMMNETNPAAEPLIYQCKVSLKGLIPPIWRKFQVSGAVTLYRLHLILQIVMGWSNQHLYQFIIEGVDYSEPPPETAWPPVQDPHRVTLNQVSHQPGHKFIYVYDFGADWQHVIKVDKILPPQPNIDYPLCLSGQRACPPENAGGIFHYTELLEILQDPTHEDYAGVIARLGEDFNPDAFDVNRVNQALREADNL